MHLCEHRAEQLDVMVYSSRSKPSLRLNTASAISESLLDPLEVSRAWISEACCLEALKCCGRQSKVWQVLWGLSCPPRGWGWREMKAGVRGEGENGQQCQLHWKGEVHCHLGSGTPAPWQGLSQEGAQGPPGPPSCWAGPGSSQEQPERQGRLVGFPSPPLPSHAVGRSEGLLG